MTADDRRCRADAADALCSAAFAHTLALQRPAAPQDHTGVALVAVGGYGRRELAPYSDLDVVLVHDEGVDVGVLAAEVWYPLWDARADVDHAVRALPEAAAAAGRDLRVALGLLDARHVAGDPSVTLRLRSALLTQWRRDARARLPELHALVRRRVERAGELAHATVPDVKESGGGLRDATVLNALVASWLVDVPHTDLERSRRALLDVRDALHAVNGRAGDRVAPDVWPDLATALGLASAAEAQRHLREIGRRTTHISRLTWRRVEDVLVPRRGPRPPIGPQRPAGPQQVPLGGGLAAAAGEVVVHRGARPDQDPVMLLRAAALAAERDLVLSPHTVARLVRETPQLPEPWSREARDLLVRLLAAGEGLLPVWETLEETGALTGLLPEWERVRLLPHASAVHRFTVDRHLVETCVEASRLVRRVARPDLLLLAALLHDLGKGGARDHSVVGAPLAAGVARRIGLPAADVTTVATLVRRHLLLAEVATTRDLEDPATVDHVRAAVGDAETLELLAALTEADARATSAAAWTTWRASLVAELVARVRVSLSPVPLTVPLTGPLPARDRDGWFPRDRDPTDPPEGCWVEVPETVRRDRAAVDVRVEPTEHGSEVTVVAADRAGLLAAVAGALALARAPVRSARAWMQEDHAVSRWLVEHDHLDAAVLRTQVHAVLDGRVDPPGRLAGSDVSPEGPSVAVWPEASRRCTVLEVRTTDRPGVLHLVCRVLAEVEVAVRSAHVTTIGAEAVDVFYLQEEGAGALGDTRAAEAAHAVRAALTSPATLEV